MTRAGVQALLALILSWLVGLVLIWLLSVMPAAAQSGAVSCGPRAEVVAWHLARRGEVVMQQGVTPDGLLIEVLINPATTEWSILATRGDGMSCLVALGDGFVPIPTALPGVPG